MGSPGWGTAERLVRGGEHTDDAVTADMLEALTLYGVVAKRASTHRDRAALLHPNPVREPPLQCSPPGHPSAVCDALPLTHHVVSEFA